MKSHERALRDASAALKRGQWALADKHLQVAQRAQPGIAAIALSRAQVAHALAQHESVLQQAALALRLDPQLHAARLLHAQALGHLGRSDEAALEWVTLVAAKVLDVQALAQAGFALAHAGHPLQGVEAFMQALAQQPDLTAAHVGLGACLRASGLFQQAAESFRTAYLIEPTHPDRLLHTVFNLRSACLWNTLAADLGELRTRIAALAAAGPEASMDQAIDPFNALAVGLDATEQRAVAQRYAQQVAARVAALAPPVLGPAPPVWDGQRRLQVGFVSADFCSHATMLLWIDALEQHDRERFEFFLYSHGVDDGSALRQRTVAAADHWVEIGALSDAQAAQRIRADGIDILVDLKGYTQNARPGLMVLRPAALQVSFLGFPGTMGSQVHDYVVGDAVVTPVSLASLYTECIAQLPVCYQPNDRRRAVAEPTTRAAHGLPPDGVVYCSFNQAYKLSPEVFGAWLAIVAAVPGSVLWLLSGGEQADRHLSHAWLAAGLAPERLVFAPKLGSADHLARLHLADLFLDTTPVNAHTTASDALWAAVPVLTVLGEAFAARVAASLVSAVGQAELICPDLPQYQAQAIALGLAPMRLQALKAQLDAARANTPLFDGARFARDFEALLIRMAQRHAQGLPPAHLLL